MSFFFARNQVSICIIPRHSHLRTYLSLLLLAPAFQIFPVFQGQPLHFAFVNMTAQIPDLLSFFHLLQHITVVRWMLFFTINLLTSNLERRLDLLFDFDNFLEGVLKLQKCQRTWLSESPCKLLLTFWLVGRIYLPDQGDATVVD